MRDKHLSTLSKSRIMPYLTALYKNDQSKYNQAIATYTAIQQRVCIYFSLIQEIEVAVRNEISQTWKSQAPNNDLLAYFNFLANDYKSPLTVASKKQLGTTITKCQKAKPKNFSENDVISNITFGFWVHLFNQQHRTFSYFAAQFQSIFGNRFASHKQLYEELERIMLFRNRLYHQEIVWNKKLAKTPADALKNLEKIYLDFEITLQKIAPERHKMRAATQILKWQYDLCFDQELFHAEILSLEHYLEN